MTRSASDLSLDTNKPKPGGKERQSFILDRNYQLPTPSTSKKFALKSKVWQILPCIAASLFAVSFGLMLGWPSPTYLKLFADDSPVPITLEVSPLIAGLLMIGNIVATPLSSINLLGPKYNLLMSLILITIGWILMWLSTSIFWLLGSRFLIGFGNGFATGQVKIYISEVCSKESRVVLMNKCLNFYVILGVLLAYSIGPFMEFRCFSLMCVYFTSACFFVCFCIPHTPNQLLRFKRYKEARRMVEVLRPSIDIEQEIAKMLQKNYLSQELTICDLLKDTVLRKNTFKLILLTFLQQFCGIPATIVYAQFILIQLGCPNSEYFAIGYIVIFLICNYLAVFHLNRFNKKFSLVLSGLLVFLVLLLQILLLIFEVGNNWPYTYFILMCLFNIFHTLGLGTVPFSLAAELFPKPAKKVVAQIQIIFYSLFAILVTKIFQVLFSAFCLYVPFCMFASTALLSVLFITVFIPNLEKEKVIDSKPYSATSTIEC